MPHLAQPLAAVHLLSVPVELDTSCLWNHMARGPCPPPSPACFRGLAVLCVVVGARTPPQHQLLGVGSSVL